MNEQPKPNTTPELRTPKVIDEGFVSSDRDEDLALGNAANRSAFTPPKPPETKTYQLISHDAPLLRNDDTNSRDMPPIISVTDKQPTTNEGLHIDPQVVATKEQLPTQITTNSVIVDSSKSDENITKGGEDTTKEQLPTQITTNSVIVDSSKSDENITKGGEDTTKEQLPTQITKDPVIVDSSRSDEKITKGGEDTTTDVNESTSWIGFALNNTAKAGLLLLAIGVIAAAIAASGGLALAGMGVAAASTVYVGGGAVASLGGVIAMYGIFKSYKKDEQKCKEKIQFEESAANNCGLDK